MNKKMRSSELTKRGKRPGNAPGPGAAEPETARENAGLITEPAAVFRKRNPFRLVDFLVILVFLSTAALGLTLFWRDLFQSLSARDEVPVGVIIIKKNVVQRRLAERSLWDRLAVESPVYPDDLIRVAQLSAATLNIDSSSLDLNENTLIRIQRPPNHRGPVQIELREGNMSLSTGAEGDGLVLNLFGTRVEAGPGTVLNAASGDEGLVIQVNEGNAQVLREGGEVRELSTGTMIAMDTSGAEMIIPGAVVTCPAPNGRYLKKEPGLFPLDFAWNRVNLEPGDILRLEIAGDRNFTQNYRSFETASGGAETLFEAGLWYWRLSFGASALSSGRLTVADAAGPELVSPVTNSVFRFHSELPQLRFQWSPKPEVSHYILEISESPDFVNPRVSRQVAAVSFIYSSLEAGTWYWRVLPEFFSAYEGSAAYSSTALFRIEKTDDPGAPAIELPEPEPPAPPPETETASRVAGPVPGHYYTIRPGDTLRRIAAEAYNDASRWTELTGANDIVNAALIFPDQEIYIPPSDVR